MGCLSSKQATQRTIIIGNEQHSGQTTWLYRLLSGQEYPTISTVGFNVECIKHYPLVLQSDFTIEDFIKEVDKRNKIVKAGRDYLNSNNFRLNIYYYYHYNYAFRYNF